LHLTRFGAAPAPNVFGARAYVVVDGLGVIADLVISGPTLDASDSMIGPMYLSPASVIRGYYNNSETSGATEAVISFAGTLFDA
jgi:hypothetical protein